MKEQRYDTLGGLSAPILVYESTEEAEKVVVGGLLTQANNNMSYRGVLPVVREIICNLVEEDTKVERISKVVGKTKAGKDIVQWEADGKYVNRVMAEKGWDDLTKFQVQVDEACRNFKEDEASTPEPLAVDLTERVRKAPTAKRLPAKYKEAAAKVLAIGNLDNVNTNVLSKINKSFTATGDTEKMFSGQYDDKGTAVAFNVSDKDAEALGWLLKEYFDYKASQELLSM